MSDASAGSYEAEQPGARFEAELGQRGAAVVDGGTRRPTVALAKVGPRDEVVRGFACRVGDDGAVRGAPGRSLA